MPADVPRLQAELDREVLAAVVQKCVGHGLVARRGRIRAGESQVRSRRCRISRKDDCDFALAAISVEAVNLQLPWGTGDARREGREPEAAGVACSGVGEQAGADEAQNAEGQGNRENRPPDPLHRPLDA